MNQLQPHIFVVTRDPLTLVIGVDAIVLHAIVVAGKSGITQGPGTGMIAFPRVDAVMAGQVAQGGEQALADLAHMTALPRRQWRLKIAVLGALLNCGVDWQRRVTVDLVHRVIGS